METTLIVNILSNIIQLAKNFGSKYLMHGDTDLRDHFDGLRVTERQQALLRHRQQRHRRPLGEPVDGAAVHQRREHTAATPDNYNLMYNLYFLKLRN